MARRKSDAEHIRKLTKMGGGSLGITFPIRVVRSLGWREHQQLIVQPRGRHLIVKDRKRR